MLKKPTVVTTTETTITKKVKEQVKTDDDSTAVTKKKKKKTAGLNIPTHHKPSSPQPSTSRGISKAQLSSFFSTQKTDSVNKPNFNDFL
jgi:hypothetical protein